MLLNVQSTMANLLANHLRKPNAEIRACTRFEYEWISACQDEICSSYLAVWYSKGKIVAPRFR